MQHPLVQNPPSSRSNRLIRIREVQAMTGLSRSYVYHLVSVGLLPAPVRLIPGGTSRAWVEAEVQIWLEQRIAERDEGVVDE